METNVRKIPGVGKDMERHLTGLGYHSVESLRGQNPEEMYRRECMQAGCSLDRCLLYVYRLAVYYAENTEHDAEKLKWWNWTDEKMKP